MPITNDVASYLIALRLAVAGPSIQARETLYSTGITRHPRFNLGVDTTVLVSAPAADLIVYDGIWTTLGTHLTGL